jgi:hypothetical protein
MRCGWTGRNYDYRGKRENRENKMSAETDAWRVAETRRIVKDFLELFYDDNRSDEEKSNLAIFTLGTMSTVVLMSDETVKKRMTEGIETQGLGISKCPPES